MENKRQFREPSETTKQKMSFRKQGCNNPNFGKPRSEETKRLISDKLKEYWRTIPSAK